MLPWGHPSPNPKRHIRRFSCFCTERTCIYFTMSRPPSSKLPLPMGDMDPHLIHDSLGPSKLTKTASRLVEPFLLTSPQNKTRSTETVHTSAKARLTTVATKIQSFVHCHIAIANLPWKFQAYPFRRFAAKLLTDRQTNKQTNKQTTRLHILLGECIRTGNWTGPCCQYKHRPTPLETDQGITERVHRI